MEARTLLQKIRQRGFTIKAVGNAISLVPKRLVNDRMIGFIREHKEVILTALYQEQDEQNAFHLEYKAKLHDGRLEVLRIILRRYLKPINPLDNCLSTHEVEEYLDDILKKHDYDLEDAITTYRNITTPAAIPHLTCHTCGYRPPFCSCGGAAMPDIITCNQCKHFVRDRVGDGSGIGHCNSGVQYTQEIKGRLPLYRFADRHCDKFTGLME